MGHSLADALYERLLSSFPATQAYTRADWNDDMPGPVAHFLDQLLRYHSRREARRLRRARTNWVDYDAPEMETAVRTFFDAMEAHTRVPADAWEDTLWQATHHSTAHLVRPVHVLTDFVYAERQKQLGLPKILSRMKFFEPYSYLRDAVQAFAKKHDLDVLGPDRFERFLHRIDERFTDTYDADQWLQLLAPLFEVAQTATGHDRVPTALLRAFFAEKGRKALEWELEAAAEEGWDQVPPKRLHRLIAEADGEASTETSSPQDRPDDRAPSRPETPSTDSSAPTDDSFTADPFSDESMTEEPSRETASPADDTWGVSGTAQPEGTAAQEAEEGRRNHQARGGDDESVPLWKRFQGGHAGTVWQQGQAKNAENENAENRSNSQEPLWARFRHERDERLSDAVTDEPSASDETASSTSASNGSDSDSSPPGAVLHEPSQQAASGGSAASASGGTDLEDLEQTVLGVRNPPHRAVYVQQLFGGDQVAYKRVLQRLSGVDSWGEASQIIAGDIFRKHKVNIYSDAAVHFTNAVESKYRDE
ncbi:MAG: hypothetical protein BRD55_05755 [Bacteroidetes bacterium SW_9_63_38]|nr:MAG: hypothetical protein BRD55_05755 [Bacteroidetes bacterium SW_9_63_38]